MKVVDEEGLDGGVLMEGVTITLIAAMYEHDEKMTLEEVSSRERPGMHALPGLKERMDDTTSQTIPFGVMV
jgi:hypothetical protein